MARPKKTDTLDTAQAIDLTAGAIERLACPAGKQQAFLRDTKAPGLRVRVTSAGHKSFVYESKLNRQNIRRTIGDVRAWTIEQARTEARRLAVLIDEGINPSEQERQQQAEREAKNATAAAQAVTMGEAWAVYIEARRPHWSALHLRDNLNLARPGGEPAKRGKRITEPGPLHHFMPQRLADVAPDVVQAWAEREGQARPTQARLALRLLRAFLNWCTERPDFAAIVPAQNPAKSRRAREALGKAGVKSDALLREQLPVWFAAVQAIGNAGISAYLQTLLLTGARPGELLGLHWDDLNVQWRGLTIRDKVEGERVIPLTPYVHHLLAGLPRRGRYVFSSTDKPLSYPQRQHGKACAVAGVEGLTLHGLRRSFKSLSEWLELPVGVIAQIQGHKPSATAEKHYTVRPLDLLRLHHEKFEGWILEQAGVQFDAKAEPGALRVVNN